MHQHQSSMIIFCPPLYLEHVDGHKDNFNVQLSWRGTCWDMFYRFLIETNVLLTRYHDRNLECEPPHATKGLFNKRKEIEETAKEATILIIFNWFLVRQKLAIKMFLEVHRNIHICLRSSFFWVLWVHEKILIGRKTVDIPHFLPIVLWFKTNIKLDVSHDGTSLF